MIKQKWELPGQKWKPLLPVTKVWSPWGAVQLAPARPRPSDSLPKPSDRLGSNADELLKTVSLHLCHENTGSSSSYLCISNNQVLF